MFVNNNKQIAVLSKESIVSVIYNSAWENQRNAEKIKQKMARRTKKGYSRQNC